MINILEIGTDSFASKDSQRRALHKKRRLELSQCVDSYHLILYSTNFNKGTSIEREKDNIFLYRIGCFKYLAPLKVLQVAFSIFKKNQIDLITTTDPLLCGILGYSLKLFFKVPLNTQLHFDYFNRYFWEDQNFFLKLIRKMCIKKVLNRCDSVRVVSSAQKRFVENKFPHISLIEIVPTPVNIDIENHKKLDSSICDNYRTSTKTKLLIYVGRLEPSKDLNTLLSAMRLIKNEYSDVKLLIIGIGSEEDNLKRLSQIMNLEECIIFLGSISNEKMLSYYSSCDVFVFTSKHEGRGTVLVEAALSKKPIVATRFSGVQDLIVDEKTGFTTDIKDYKAFANKVLILLNNPDMINEFGRNGFEYVSKKIGTINSIKVLVELWEKTVYTSKK